MESDEEPIYESDHGRSPEKRKYMFTEGELLIKLTKKTNTSRILERAGKSYPLGKMYEYASIEQ